MDDRRATFTRVVRPRLHGEPWTFISPFTLWEEARHEASRPSFGGPPSITRLHEQAIANDEYNEFRLKWLPMTELDTPWVDEMRAALPPPPPDPPRLGMAEWFKRHDPA